MPRRRPTSEFSASRLALVAVSLLAYGLNVFGYPLQAPLQAAAPPSVAADNADATDATESSDASAAPKRCSCCCGVACAGGTQCCCKPSAQPNPPVQAPSPEAPSSKSSVAPTGVTWVNGVQARQCRGEATAWVTQGAALPPPLHVEWSFEWTPQGVATFALPALASVTLDRTTPPPRPI